MGKKAIRFFERPLRDWDVYSLGEVGKAQTSQKPATAGVVDHSGSSADWDGERNSVRRIRRSRILEARRFRIQASSTGSPSMAMELAA